MNAPLKIALGTDHAGYELKECIRLHLISKGYEVRDFGAFNIEASDYPVFVQPAARSVASGECDLGVVFGGSGNGEAIAANKVKGVRCALCWDTITARLAKEHNDANVISLGGRLVTPDTAREIVDTWIASSFEGGRHARRLSLIEE